MIFDLFIVIDLNIFVEWDIDMIFLYYFDINYY